LELKSPAGANDISSTVYAHESAARAARFAANRHDANPLSQLCVGPHCLRDSTQQIDKNLHSFFPTPAN
jgi:hypothetical protein